MAFYIVACVLILLVAFGVLIWRKLAESARLNYQKETFERISQKDKSYSISSEVLLQTENFYDIEWRGKVRPRPCAGSNFALPPSSWENGPNGQISSQPSKIKRTNAVRH